MRFGVYKRNQGRITRQVTAAVMMLVMAIGLYRLSQTLQGTAVGWQYVMPFTQMLQYAQAFDGPSLALLVEHDDAEREYAYASTAASFSSSVPLAQTARDEGWTVISMRDDWASVYAHT